MNIIHKTKRSQLRNSLLKVFIGLTVLFSTSSCNDFLNIMPDNVAILDHAFSNEIEAEKYLFTCYSYLPNEGSVEGNVGMISGDELWVPDRQTAFNAGNWYTIANGRQNRNNPRANYWDGFEDGKPLFKGIRDCNIFLENIENVNKVRNLPLDKRARWIAEAKFLKAYYHFYLLRMYGPIPIVDKNIAISALPHEVHVKRDPVDNCVNYIANLLDESNKNLPVEILRRNDELGRITQPINRAVKAKLLLLAASPLFNGNSDYANFKNKDGEKLFNTTYDETKWQKAADAAKEAIDIAEAYNGKLYRITNTPFPLTEAGTIQMSIRNAICEKWNDELIWCSTNSRAGDIQGLCMPLLYPAMNTARCNAAFAPPLKIVRQFYSKNGVPINEDKTLDFSDEKALRAGTADERVNFEVGYQTARINFDRENRFYANVGFDGGRWLMFYEPTRSDISAYVLKAKKGQLGAGVEFGKYSETGYFTKKLVNWESVYERDPSVKEYPWPVIRLADVYLMYAEALNEAQGPEADVHKYLNLIRDRAGLKSVNDSWSNFSNNPSKPSTKDGMRAIIHQERLIELSFEGQRFWDLRRWKTAVEVLNTPITGWTISQVDINTYYQVRTIEINKQNIQPFIAPRDYLWPIRKSELDVNPNLVQNPGW